MRACAASISAFMRGHSPGWLAFVPILTPMWSNFFVAAAGASAALAGLVFVAVSLNIQRILQFQNLPARAAAAISALILILVSSVAALIPQGATPLGAEILGFACFAWLVQGVSSYRALAAK